MHWCEVLAGLSAAELGAIVFLWRELAHAAEAPPEPPYECRSADCVCHELRAPRAPETTIDAYRRLAEKERAAAMDRDGFGAKL